MLRLSVPWTRQPPMSTQVDTGRFPGLTEVWRFDGSETVWNVLSGERLSRGNRNAGDLQGQTTGRNFTGIACNEVTTGTTNTSYFDLTNAWSQTEFTVLALLRPEEIPASVSVDTGAAFNGPVFSSDTYQIFWYSSDANFRGVFAAVIAGGPQTNLQQIDTIVAGEWAVMGGSYSESVGRLRSYHLNKLQEEKSVSGNMTGTIAPSFFRSNASNARQWNGAMALVLVWDIELPQSQAESICVNPWQVFQPRTTYIPVEVAAVGGRIMSSLAYSGGLAHKGGIAGKGGGLAG